ncbi:ras guanine nucleotide exchange factor domain-containing protein [Fennellomyces sp. T-0311]|nr:ras guanine nucleotide exchange factor domain-containing protein [Fennellomyces sp. T-0311]
MTLSHAVLVPTSPKTQPMSVSLSPPASLPSSPRNASAPAPSTLTSHFVQALHDYLPTNAPADEAVSCLFFRKGAIIEVFNRDSSGWWDGLSGGVRGWFPSNYVGRIGEAVRHSADFDDEESQQEWETWRKHATPAIEEEDPMDQVETTTSAKQSRVELARALLNEDRRKSNTSEPAPPPPEKDDDPKVPAIPSWEALMDDVQKRMSELVEACATSTNTQLAIFQVVSSIRAVLTAANTVSNDSPILKSHPELARQRKIILSALSKLVLKGKELQSAEQPKSDEQVPSLANQLLSEMTAFEEILKTVPEFMSDDQTRYATPNGSHHSISPRSSLVSVESSSSLRQQLVDARLSSVSLIAKAVPLSDAQNILQSLLEHQATIDELMTGLLATIEKFLANRQRATEMLETTRKAVEAIRNFLAVVEHVCSNVGDIDYKHYSIIPEDPHLVALVLAKESVYSAITNLVTSVRALAGPRGRSTDDYDHLRESCENVVRTTNDSAARVRICLQVDVCTTTKDEDDVSEMREKLESSVDARRNQTLSILGRKVTSLNVLQHQYADDDDSSKALERVDEHEVENLDIAQQAKSVPPVPPSELARRSRAMSKSRNSKLARSDTVRRSNNVPPRGSSAASSTRTSSTSQLRQSVESLTPMTSPEVMSPNNTYPAIPPATYQQNNSSSSLMSIPPPPPPKSTSTIKAQPDLKILSSKSTPTADQSSRTRRPREMSISAFRMSLKNRNDDQRNSTASSETLVEPPRIRRTSSWLSMSEQRRESEQVAKGENDPWFLKQRVFSEDEMMFNSEGQVTGATIEALVEKLTQHEKSPELMFTRSFFYNFRLFTTPTRFLELLVKRFDIQPPADTLLTSEDLAVWTSRVLVPVRLRVYNVIKTWIETYFCYESDACTEKMLVDFTAGPLMHAMPGPSKRMMELIRKRFTSKGMMTAGRKLSYASEPRPTLHKQPSGSHISLSAGTSLFSTLALFEDHHHSEPAVAPPPNITRSLRNTLRKAMSQGILTTIHINEFDPLEIARQLTLMENSLFCQIQPNEMIGQEFKKKVGSSTAIHVKAMIQRSTQITSWVSDTILHESDVKKRAQMIKLWIKIGDHCLQLQNYNTLMAIRSALDSTSIARLKRTWEYVSAKYKAMYDPIYRATDSQRNFAEYRRRLKNAAAPCLPFLGVYLTDMTFIDDGNANHRTSVNGHQLINFDKYIKTTRILSDIDQFQIAYKLTEVEEIQRYLLQCLETVQKDDQVFYTRSLQLEPREEEFDIKSFISSLA